MADRNSTGNLLSFPAPAPAPGSSAEDWDRRILETRDNLVSALDFLRTVYNEWLAGRPIKAADEILAQVDTILRHDEKIPAGHQDSWMGAFRSKTKGPSGLSGKL
jgi:hypothetical protein